MSQPRGLDAGRVPVRVAVGFRALTDGARTAYRATLARDRLLGATLGIGSGLAADALLWQSFWHDLTSRSVAVAMVTALATVLLMLPVRAVAGAFALTLSLSITAMAVQFFATSPAGVQTGQAVTGQTGASQVGGFGVGADLPAPTFGPSPQATPSPPTGVAFGHEVFDAPVAGRGGWEPVSPCHSRVRTAPGQGSRPNPVATGPCELLASAAR